MSHQDRMSECVTNHQTIKQVVDRILPARLFASMKVRKGSTWKPRMLAVAALLWGGGEASTLDERFSLGRRIVNKVFRWQAAVGETYQGFLKVLHNWHSTLRSAVTNSLRTLMQQGLPDSWQIGGFTVFAVDGSRVELARTESNEAAFSPSKKRKKKQQHPKEKSKSDAAQKRGLLRQKRRRLKQAEQAKQEHEKLASAEAAAKKASSPQLWLTLIWHIGSGLPWAWRTGPSDSSERDHLKEMLAELPLHSLITADAGFVGFAFLLALLTAQHHFLVRIGGNVKLLKNLGYAREHAQTVYLWPNEAAKKLQPPLVLRLITIHDGKHTMYLLTNLTKTQLSDSLAAKIYARRWGIELFFRTFKQTFERRKMLSHAGKNCPLELDWSLLALWAVCLLGRQELEKSGQEGHRLSPAKAIQAFRKCVREYRVRPETSGDGLLAKLRDALLDGYTRTSSKTSRNYPRQKKRERVGPPTITRATQPQILQAKELKMQSPEIQLTA